MNTQIIKKKIQDHDGLNLDVHSIFQTIQGEGPFSGSRAVFIRLMDCNLRCPGCDTNYTKDGLGSMTVVAASAEVLAAFEGDIVTNNDLQLVVITGGEPFRQNITPLVELLSSWGCVIQVETNGTLPPSKNLPYETILVVSPKAGKINKEIIEIAEYYKYVLDHKHVDYNDGLPLSALGHSAKPHLAKPPSTDKTIFIQPMDMGDDNYQHNQKNLASCTKSALMFGYTVQVQLHKQLGIE